MKTEVIDLDDYSSPVQTYESLVEDEEDEDFCKSFHAISRHFSARFSLILEA